MKPALSPKRVAATLFGSLLLLLGLVLSLPLVPGPGLLVMVAGLAVLATEYEWARRRYQQLKAKLRQAKDKIVTSSDRTD